MRAGYTDYVWWQYSRSRETVKMHWKQELHCPVEPMSSATVRVQLYSASCRGLIVQAAEKTWGNKIATNLLCNAACKKRVERDFARATRKPCRLEEGKWYGWGVQVKNRLQEQRNRQREEQKYRGEQKWIQISDVGIGSQREFMTMPLETTYAEYEAKRYERAVPVKESPHQIDH